MTFSAFRASKAFKTMFDEFVSMGADVEKSAGRALTSKEIKTILADDKTLQTRLRASLNSFIDASRHEGIDAAEAQRQFVTGLMGQLPPQTRAALSQEGAAAEKELAAVKASLNNLVSEKPAGARPLAASPRVDRVPQPTGVIDGLIRNPEKLAKVGGPSVTTALRDYETVLEGAIKRVNRDGVKELSAAEKVAFRAVGDAFKKDSTEAGRGITATQAHDNLLDAMGFEKGTKTRQEMSALLGKPAEGGGRKPPPAARQEPTFDEPPAPRKTEPAEAAGEPALTRAEKAEQVISNSIIDMGKVKNENGKMPKEAFFSDLQDALRTKGLLVVNREGALATTPQQVYSRVAAREAVTEEEMGTLATYFGRYHNDRKAAAAIAAQQPAMQTALNRPGIASIAESVIRRVPISENNRMTPTLAQNHAWETGNTSFWLNQASAFQEKPIRKILGTTAIAASGFFLQQTAVTFYDFEHPTLVGREILGAITPDQVPGVHDYIEFVNGRYLGNIPLAEQRLKELYGIEKLKSEEDQAKAVDAIIRGPLPQNMALKDTKPISPDVMRALTMYVSQAVYGVSVVEPNELVNLKNQRIVRDAETDAAKVTAANQSALQSDYVPQMSGGQRSQQPAYSQYPLDGEVFNNRLKSVASDEPTLYTDLANAFKKVTSMPVADEAELTTTNKVTSDELAAFAEEAKNILSQHKVDPKEQEQMIDILTKPVAAYAGPSIGR